MEGLKSSHEKKPVSLVLEDACLDCALGSNLKEIIEDLVRVYAVAKHLAERNVATKKEIREVADDLFKEFGVQIFGVDVIFTDEVANQIINASTITDISLTLNDHPVKITSGITAESVMSAWQDSYSRKEDPSEKQNKDMENKERISKSQEKADVLFKDLDSIDFTNTTIVIDWLINYNNVVSDVGVEDHKKEVIKKFRSNSYSIEEDNRIKFFVADTFKDKNQMSKAFISHMLANMGLVRPSDIENFQKKILEFK